MNSILYSSDFLTVSYSGVLIALGTASCFCMTWSFFRAAGGKGRLLCFFLPVSTPLSVFFSRLIHWYCHSEQYESIRAALTDYGAGGYVLTGVLLAILLAALFLTLFPCRAEIPLLLDCLAPGAVILFICIRLSSLFNSSCRSKITVSDPSFQRLPFAAAFTDAAGNIEYRFATFFAEVCFFAVLLAVLLVFLARESTAAVNNQNRRGRVWLQFLNWICAIEVLADSTRFDSSFTRLNGFVSVVQTVSGVLMLAVLLISTVRTVRADRLRLRHVLIWLFWLLSLGGAGISEYLVQRHGDWYLSCYLFMAFWLTMMAGLTSRMILLSSGGADTPIEPG